MSMISHRPRCWRIAPHDEVRVRQLSRALNVPFLVAQVLAARGYVDREQARSFLEGTLYDLHDPSLLPGIDEAADRIVSAIRAGRRITIYGDYDVDGVAATSLLWRCLRLAGANADYYIPDRLEEGYGLNCDAIRRLHQQDPNRVIVSVDCGIASLAEAELARQLNLELIVTDHHELASELPAAAVLVHPRLPGSSYPFPQLCGCGVAFKLAWAICQRLGDGRRASPRMREFLIEAISLVALATVADVVPLTGENRILVRYGLTSLARRAGVGLQSLLRVANLEDTEKLDAEHIAFQLGPRINAAGRLGQARLAVELLTTEDAERATRLALYLEQLNRDRQTLERRITKEAKDLVAVHPEWLERGALVLHRPGWHAGVVGIVASRVAEYFERPTILLVSSDEGILQGSGRTYGCVNLFEVLSQCREHLVSFGGHAAAAGVKLEHCKLDAFREAFCRAVEQAQAGKPEQRDLYIDAEVRFADLTKQAVDQLDRLGPFGEGNPRPVFATAAVDLVEPPRLMGESQQHLSLKVHHYGTVMRAVAFGRARWGDQIAQVNGSIAISFVPKINSFKGRHTVELELIDWQPTELLRNTASIQHSMTGE